MKKLWLGLPLVLASCFFSSAYAYNKADLKQFEKTNKCNQCDLSGATLRKNHSNAELIGANLSNASLPENGNFALANLSNANLSGANLYGANFSHANLTGTHFDGAYMIHANLSGAIRADLSHARACKAILPDGSEGSCAKNTDSLSN